MKCCTFLGNQSKSNIYNFCNDLIFFISITNLKDVRWSHAAERGEVCPSCPAGAPRSPRTPSRSQRTRCFVYIFTYFFPKCLVSDQGPSAFSFFGYFSIRIKVFLTLSLNFLYEIFMFKCTSSPIRAYVNSILKNFFLKKKCLVQNIEKIQGAIILSK